MTHKTSSYIEFYEVTDEISAINKMNILSQKDYIDQKKYAYYYEVKENLKLKDIYDLIVQNQMIYNTWSNNCQHYLKDKIKKFIK